MTTPQTEPVLRVPRWLLPLGVVALVLIVASIVVGLVVALDAQSTSEALRAGTAGGSKTCSGQNVDACDRICPPTAARIFVTVNGHRLPFKFHCQHSNVTAAPPGSNHPLRGVVIGPVAARIPKGQGGDWTPGTIIETVPSHRAPGRQQRPNGTAGETQPGSPNGSGGSSSPSGGTSDNNPPPSSGDNPLGNVIQTVKTTVCNLTDQVLGNC